MRQTVLSRLGKPPELSEPKLFRAARQEHHRICNSACVEIPGLGAASATLHTITIEVAHNHDRECRVRVGSCAWLVLRHELPDQHVLDHRIIASYGLIAPLVTMSCRLLLRRVASRGVLPRASGLVLWHETDMPERPDVVRSRGKAEVAFQGTDDRF